MKMYIPRVLRHHFGTYACKAKNPRGDTDGIITLSGKKFLGYARLLEVQPLNTSYLTDSYINFTLKMEFVSKNPIFWPKNDGEKWSRKIYFEIPPCGKMIIFITE